MNSGLKTPLSGALSGATTASVQHDVVVVGGGLAGVACALACAQAGLDVALIAGVPASEGIAATPELWDRRVYAINPASQGFLAALKIWPQLDATRIAAVHDMRIYGAAAVTAKDPKPESSALHFSAYEAASVNLAWIVEHRELARVLNTALQFQQRATRINLAAETITVSDDQVTVTTAQGPVLARLLVGADGAQSRVRTALNLEHATKPYDQSGVVANFACTRAHGGTAHQWFTRAGVVALLPLPGANGQDAGQHAVSLVWSAPAALAQEIMQDTPTALVQRLEGLIGTPLGALTPLGGMAGFPLELLTTTRQIGQRSVLVGDAAHVVHPLAGQGLNLGLQDVEVLCRLLREREPFRDCGDALLLRRYERARKAPVWAMRQATDGLQRLFASEDAVLGRARNLGMNLLNRLPVIKRTLIHQAMGKP